MNHIFEVIDKTGRKIRLTKKQWTHIRTEHPHIDDFYEIEKVIVSPDKIFSSNRDEKVQWYFLYNKIRKRYLKVSVKYLNGEGYIVTAHYTTKIQ